MVTMRAVREINVEEERERKEPQEDKVKKNASQFLNAWIEGRNSDINRNSFSANVGFHTKKTFFEDVQLHKYEIISCEVLDGNKADIHVSMSLNIRGNARKKRIVISAMKIKKEWRIDIKSLLPS